ncbi:catabolite control protein A [Atopobacter sp. AH10]|uniref:catabolite control protein A n=1 Tax=Atopobacter sp. AH10 TaxID=2315861 RepID=UPI000EF17A79|nr:catabolite control protein A [Atopobacter sp. AH10]RLK63972.1 catabolite control protein A [Atopobacter sp. AH10]
MEKQTITIYDVAREAGVSMATVSRVVNANANVKPTTRKKVLEVIDRLDYRPNAVARGLASKKTTTVGVLIPDVTNLYFSTLARGIDDVASMYKYNIILANSDKNSQKEIQVLNALLNKQVDGVIYMGTKISDDMRREMNRSKAPVVLAGTVDYSDDFASVNINNEEATYEVVTHMIKEGHKRVAFVCEEFEDPINCQARLKGYKRALAEAKIDYDENLIFESGDKYVAGEDLADKFKQMNIDAAFVTDDEVACGILNGLTDSGVKVPEEFSVFSSNNTKLTHIVRPSLSSIAPPLYDIGAVAMRLLTKLMNNEKVEDEHIMLPHKIEIKGSTINP